LDKLVRILEIVVCIKQVPDPRYFSRITVDPEKKTLKREGIPAIINPLDKNAIEEALRLKEEFGGRVTAISMGPPQAEDACREALAMGVDDAILLCDKAFAGADTLITAYTLANAIKRLEKYDLILCGNETVDGCTAQVPPQLAELLGRPNISHVRKIEVTSEWKIRVERSIEDGYLIIEAKMPAVLAVTKTINTPRIPSVPSISAAYRKNVTMWTTEDTGLEESKFGIGASPTQVVAMFTIEIKRRSEILKGPSEEVTHQLALRLRELGVL